MITIHNLEVQFDVEGDDDREVFGRLFREFIQRWQEETERERERESNSQRERSLNDTTMGGA